MESDNSFSNRFTTHLNEIETELKEGFSSGIPLMDDIGRHSLLGQGKRLRPLLFSLSSMLCGYKDRDVYRISTLFEYFHCASLLHDDVIDDAETRRNKPSVKSLWGNPAAVLTGDYLSSRAMSIALGTNNIDFLRMIVNTGERMAAGQFLELVHTDDWEITRNRYMEVITAKTAELTAAACACGGIISGAGDDEIQSLQGFGLNLGTAFQLIDDLLDYSSTEEQLGKPAGKDIREGKITLPLIYTLQSLGDNERQGLKKLFTGSDVIEGDFERLMTMVKDSGAVDRVREEARGYADRAAEFMAVFQDSPFRDDLIYLNKYMSSRKF